MKCIYCNHNDSKVIDSRYFSDNNTIRRRRECLNPNCQKRFNTFEHIETVNILVIKTDGTRQSFNPEKIKSGIAKACEKRPISINQIETIVDNIEKKLQNSFKQEIPSSEIGELIMDQLKTVDEVAYIRFASVYRKFTDITHFVKFIKDFEKLIDTTEDK